MEKIRQLLKVGAPGMPYAIIVQDAPVPEDVVDLHAPFACLGRLPEEMPAEGRGGEVEGRAFKQLLELAVMDELDKALGQFLLGWLHGFGDFCCLFSLAGQEKQQRQKQ